MKRATGAKALYDKFKPISIHALVKRATVFIYICFINNLISIHALVKRATVSGKKAHTYHGISIHALVKRATR